MTIQRAEFKHQLDSPVKHFAAERGVDELARPAKDGFELTAAPGVTSPKRCGSSARSPQGSRIGRYSAWRARFAPFSRVSCHTCARLVLVRLASAAVRDVYAHQASGTGTRFVDFSRSVVVVGDLTRRELVLDAPSPAG